MTWFKVDDTFAHHYKISAAGNAAVGLWTRAGAWSMQNLTDGHIPGHVVRGMGSKRQAERLVWAGLWDPDPLDGYRFHDWAEYQPSPDAVRYRRDSARLRQERHRNRDRDAGGRFEPRSDDAAHFRDERRTNSGPDENSTDHDDNWGPE